MFHKALRPFASSRQILSLLRQLLVASQKIAIAACALVLIPPAQASEPATRPVDRMAFLDNGKIRLGVDLDLGGAITWISQSNNPVNLVNSFDWGRQIQMSFYSGPVPFTPDGKQPAAVWRDLGWNPIQAGDHFRNRSRTIEYHNDGKRLTLKCIPMQWPLNNVPGECVFASSLALDGNTIHADCRLINHRADATQYPARFQELPAIYLNGPWWRLMTYNGDQPFTHAPLVQIPAKMLWTHWTATEHWAALVNDQNQGLGIFEPDTYTFSGGFNARPGAGGPGDNPTGYLSPLQLEILDNTIEYDFSYVLILGSLDEIRDYVYAHAPPAALPEFRFTKDRRHFHYHDAVDTGFPIRGELNIKVTGHDPQIISPACFFKAADAPKIWVEAAFHQTAPQARLRWKRLDDDQFSEEKTVTFSVKPDGEYHRYELNPAAANTYRSAITGLRLDPIIAAGKEASVRIRSLSLTPPKSSPPRQE